MVEALGPEALGDVVTGYKLAAALHAAVELGVPDGLCAGPRTADDLSAELGVSAVTLERLLRLLVAHGALVLNGAHYSNSPLTESLVAGPNRDMFLGWQTLTPFVIAWQRLAEAIRTDRPPFVLAHGEDLHDYFDSHPVERALYDAANGSTVESFEALVGALDLAAASTVVCVGGASGMELVPVLRKWPHLRGILADLPGALTGAPAVLAEHGVADRVTIVPTDARRSVPAGDVYLLSTVLRCLDDDDAIAVLRACHEASNPNATIHVTEMPLSDGPPEHPSATADVTAWVAYGGADRTIARWRQLHAAAGWRDLEFTPIDDAFSVLSSRR